MGRSHLVLVPGFGGFDALGQMHYYTRVVERLQVWRMANPGRDLACHFFDNLPTAAVATRGQDLIAYVDKLFARHVIREGDAVAMLGHSTGGLDVRWALDRWGKAERERVQRVVFMSVPHHGTNIADFVAAQASLVGMLRFGLRRAPWLAARVLAFVKWRGELKDSELVTLAIDDVLAELVERDDPWLAAQARDAASELALWRVQMASDFAAIDDLETGAFSCALPDHVRCLSFATVAPNPFDEPLVEDRGIRTLESALALAHDHAADPGATDTIFRLAYAACSAGPFVRKTKLPWLPGCGRDGEAAIEPWDNDGIVNTASMPWESGETWLVPGDHADIIGHYYPWPKSFPTGRQYEAYNLLRSASGFVDRTFHAVWDRVFDFAASAAAS